MHRLHNLFSSGEDHRLAWTILVPRPHKIAAGLEKDAVAGFWNVLSYDLDRVKSETHRGAIYPRRFGVVGPGGITLNP